MPQGLLRSRPFTVDGYNGEGLCLAMGILGRNKGQSPRTLVYDFDDMLKNQRGITRNRRQVSTTTELENTSVWSPRPNKVMRSYYTKAMEEQFGGLQKPFVGAATELSLIFLDCTHRALRDWLRFNLEQQAMDVNRYMSRPQTASLSPHLKASNHQLETLYRASYVSMIISLNYFAPGGSSSDNKTESGLPVRPDLTCFALLYLAEGADKSSQNGFVPGNGAEKPHWWDQPWVGSRLKAERSSLRGNWEEPTAWLLGLTEWPEGLKNNRIWPLVIYQPGAN
ncbi:MAG: hypothetical protein M1835_008007 [Candelina submexicana]|nr:MAG: hypothetical protein M1835_008007 [Candelina submexicana]